MIALYYELIFSPKYPKTPDMTLTVQTQLLITAEWKVNKYETELKTTVKGADMFEG